MQKAHHLDSGMMQRSEQEIAIFFIFLEKRKREEKVSYCPHALIMVFMLFISTEGNICRKPYRGDLEGFKPPERTYFCV